MINPQRIKEAIALLEREVAHVIFDPDEASAREKYGPTLIRVDWRYAKAAFASPVLRRVCTWSNGDEGFVIEPPSSSADTVRPEAATAARGRAEPSP